MEKKAQQQKNIPTGIKCIAKPQVGIIWFIPDGPCSFALAILENKEYILRSQKDIKYKIEKEINIDNPNLNQFENKFCLVDAK